MNVTIVGAGNMARGIATRALAGGNSVRLVDVEPQLASALAHELAPQGQGNGTVTAGTVDDPIDGDLIVLAVPYGAASSIATDHAADLAGKVVVDISNPVDLETFDRLVTPPGTSAAEEIAELLPEARIVKAFNTTFAGTLEAGDVAGQPLDVFVAGDDQEAKERVIGFALAGGLRPIDAGPLRRARELEALQLLHMSLQGPLGTGFRSAVKVIA